MDFFAESLYNLFSSFLTSLSKMTYTSRVRIIQVKLIIQSYHIYLMNKNKILKFTLLF